MVKSFLSCLSSSFAFSVNSGSERAPHLGLILDNVRQAIEHQGLSPTTQRLLRQVLEHLTSFEAETIDSTELDFLIDGATRDIWSGNEDCGIRVFIKKPSVSLLDNNKVNSHLQLQLLSVRNIASINALP